MNDLAPVKKKKKLYLRLSLILLLVLTIYPVFVLTYTYNSVISVNFEGGKNGPLDAYRHTLASAVVTYTIGEWAVALVTTVCENNESKPCQMDRHNNKVGRVIGANAKNFSEIKSLVMEAVKHGTVNTENDQQVTWLPKRAWQDGIYF